MHIIDIGGIAGDIGFLAIQSTMARLRGAALGMADLLAGTRFQKSYVKPGGVAGNIEKNMVAELKSQTKKLREDLKTPLAILFSNQVARERMQNIGILSEKLARDFGVVGIAARASGIAYDTRQNFAHGVYPELKVPVALWKKGDVYCRTRVRADELRSSLDIVEQLLDGLEDGEHCARIPEELPADAVGLGIVESHRGELIHLVFTNEKGNIQRYAIKDPSINNWTALAITVRNNLVSDFPLCNKSFSLSYSGHDL